MGGKRKRDRSVGERRRRTAVSSAEMASSAPQPPSSEPDWLEDLTVRHAQGNLLEVEPLDLGPGAPASRALELDRAEASAATTGT